MGGPTVSEPHKSATTADTASTRRGGTTSTCGRTKWRTIPYDKRQSVYAVEPSRNAIQLSPFLQKN